MNCYRDIKMEFLIITVLLLMSKMRTGDRGETGELFEWGYYSRKYGIHIHACFVCTNSHKYTNFTVA